MISSRPVALALPRPLASSAARPQGGRRTLLGITGTAFALHALHALPVVARSQDVARGTRAFAEGRIDDSVAAFDAALAASPGLRGYLWQRGIALYYAQRFADGAKQFRDDVAVNPGDSEEAIWAYLCECQLNGPDAARSSFLTVGRDARPLLRSVEMVIKNGGAEEEIAAAASASASDEFYSLLYRSLYVESIAGRSSAAARELMEAATQTTYAQRSGDFMATVAKTHVRLRAAERSSLE